ncbi:hypothetical protein H312_01801 [Anncaliia algerae PRA339]|uniref:Uncharacterized protein n=1 Tax=Anncaliia algerae PRA339 TaxID=1288291 RepID=A0A059F1A9_9MICR|nr:hypothetical protein H312_01801 [Anncaliia algerae PRA339]
MISLMTVIKPKQIIKNSSVEGVEGTENSILCIEKEVEATETPVKNVKESKFIVYLKKLTIPWLECGEIIFLITAVSLGFFKFDNYLYFNCIYYASFLSLTSKLLSNLHANINHLYDLTVLFIDFTRYIIIYLQFFRITGISSETIGDKFSNNQYLYLYFLIYAINFLTATYAFKSIRTYSIKAILILNIVFYLISFMSFIFFDFVTVIFNTINLSLFIFIILYELYYQRNLSKEKLKEIYENNRKFNFIRFIILPFYYYFLIITFDRNHFNRMFSIKH